MWFSRIWIALLAGATALAIATATLVPKPAARELQSAHSYKLDLVQHNTNMVLKLQARALIDQTSDLSRDDRLVSFLEQAGAKQAKYDVLKSQTNARLLELLSQYKKDQRPELFIAVDYRGKQIGRVGPGEDFKPGVHGLAGYPVVGAALRGFLRDDTWSVDGQLYFVAAVPVISRAKDRYLGALVLGQRVDKAFASQLKRQLVAAKVSFLAQTEFAFYLRGKLLSASAESKALALLPGRYASKRDKVVKVGRSEAFLAGPSGKRRVVVVAPLPGAAAAHDAFYAIVAPTTAPLGVFASLDRLQGADFGAGTWLLGAGTLLGLLVVGLVILQLEGPRPLAVLLAEVRKVVKNDISRLADHRYSGDHRDLAKLVNELVDRATNAAQKQREGKNIERILDHGEAGATRIDSGGLAMGGGMPPLAGAGGAEFGDYGADQGMGHGVGMIDELPNPAAGVMPLSGLGAEEDAPTLNAHAVANDPFYSDANLPVLTPMELPPSDSMGGGDGDFHLGPPASAPAPGRRSAAAPSLEVRVTAQGGRPDPSDAQPFGSGSNGMDTVVEAPAMQLPAAQGMPQLDSSAGEDDQEDYFRQVFNEFVAIKKSCGENTDNITYDRFVAKLRKNRASLVERYSCSDVKFRVYIKDGKAALKATPITD